MSVSVDKRTNDVKIIYSDFLFSNMEHYELDKLDKEILAYLTDHARASFREISKALNVSVGTVKNRIEKLEKNGVLLGFAPIINHDRLGWNINVIIALTVDRGHTGEVLRKLSGDPRVRSIYLATGNVDIFIRARFRDTNELRDFLMKDMNMDGIKSSITYTILDKKTRKGFIE